MDGWRENERERGERDGWIDGQRERERETERDFTAEL